VVAQRSKRGERDERGKTGERGKRGKRGKTGKRSKIGTRCKRGKRGKRSKTNTSIIDMDMLLVMKLSLSPVNTFGVWSSISMGQTSSLR
jgi:hypothetical protein